MVEQDFDAVAREAWQAGLQSDAQALIGPVAEGLWDGLGAMYRYGDPDTKARVVLLISRTKSAQPLAGDEAELVTILVGLMGSIVQGFAGEGRSRGSDALIMAAVGLAATVGYVLGQRSGEG